MLCTWIIETLETLWIGIQIVQLIIFFKHICLTCNFLGIGKCWEPPLSTITRLPVPVNYDEYHNVVDQFLSTIEIKFHGYPSNITANDVEILEVRPGMNSMWKTQSRLIIQAISKKIICCLYFQIHLIPSGPDDLSHSKC